MITSLPFTSVVSYHTNEYGCGVAKFGKQLAERLGVPFVGWENFPFCSSMPLLSLKWSEIDYEDRDYLRDTIRARVRANGLPFAVFWHDAGDAEITKHATHVFYADPSLGSPGLWCPSLLTPSKPRTVKLFSFGMAHKLQTQHYRRVRELLDAAGLPYHLRVSVGLHEGTSLSDATQHFDDLKAIMGPENVTILGILSDEAVSQELNNADCVVAFFEKGLRANNTTVFAALDASCPVLTNHDDQTPVMLRHRTGNILEIQHWSGAKAYSAMWSWDALIEAMRKECDKSRSAIA